MELLPFAQSFVAAGELLPEDGRLDLLLQLLTTLVYIHRCDIIHRDLKPGNVLVTAGGEVKVLDFGLAGLPGEELPTSGTLPYMAPELLQGQPPVSAPICTPSALWLMNSLPAGIPSPTPKIYPTPFCRKRSISPWWIFRPTSRPFFSDC
jgi:serine/threonine protein kinase